MTSSCPHASFDFYNEENLQLIQTLAKRLCASGRLRPHDIEDVTQEIIIAVAEQWSNFDPAEMELPGFINKVARARCRQLRMASQHDPISEPYVLIQEDYEVDPAAETTPCLGQAPDPMEAVHNRLDGLPSYLQDFAMLLLSNSLDEILHLTGISARAYHKRIDHLRCLLVAADPALANHYPKAKRALERLREQPQQLLPTLAELEQALAVAEPTLDPLDLSLLDPQLDLRAEAPGSSSPVAEISLESLSQDPRTQPGPNYAERMLEGLGFGKQAGKDPGPKLVLSQPPGQDRKPGASAHGQSPGRLLTGPAGPLPIGRGGTAGPAQARSEPDRFGEGRHCSGF